MLLLQLRLRVPLFRPACFSPFVHLTRNKLCLLPRSFHLHAIFVPSSSRLQFDYLSRPCYLRTFAYSALYYRREVINDVNVVVLCLVRNFVLRRNEISDGPRGSTSFSRPSSWVPAGIIAKILFHSYRI